MPQALHSDTLFLQIQILSPMKIAAFRFSSLPEVARRYKTGAGRKQRGFLYLGGLPFQ